MNKPRVLLFDIETKPVKFWGWRTGDTYLRHDQIVEGERFDIICICYRWAHEKKVNALTWDKQQSSAKMINDFVKVLETADVVVGQNSDSFDVKQVNTQRMLHGQPPIAWPTSEDTRKQIKKHFYVTSSSLAYMSQLLGGKKKQVDMNFQDWVDIVDKRSAKKLAKMVLYCKRDVDAMYDVWKKIAPYVEVRAHRGKAARNGNASCPSCGHADTLRIGGRLTLAGRVQRLQCKKCMHCFAHGAAVPIKQD
jgi:hypothetical protein